MDAITRRLPQRRPSGLRGGIIIGLALGLLGAAVGTATGAVTPFQQVVIKNTAAQPIPVTGTINVGNTPANQNVTVSNFPPTQPVSGTVSVGNFPAGPLATKLVTEPLTTDFGGENARIDFEPMNVTSVIVADGDGDNFDVRISGFILASDHEGNFSEHFPAAFPANYVEIHCANFSDGCDVWVTVLGY